MLPFMCELSELILNERLGTVQGPCKLESLESMFVKSKALGLHQALK